VATSAWSINCSCRPFASQAAIAVENAQLYRAVAQDQQRMQAVLQNAADAILMFDANGGLLLLNPAGFKNSSVMCMRN